MVMQHPKSSLSPVCIVSRYKSLCVICADWIDIGQSMFPFTSASDELLCCWAHEECSVWFGRNGVPPAPCCRHWSRLGKCPLQEAQAVCAFRHDEADRHSYEKKKKWGGSRILIRNRHKNSAFRIFLLQTYGIDYLQNAVILDVAGGKGELSWEILNLVGCNQSFVVDPRGPLCTRRMDQLWKKGMFDPRRTGPVFSKWYPAVQPQDYKTKLPKKPQHIRCFLDGPSFLSLLEDKEDNDEEWFQLQRNRASRIQWTTQGLQNNESSNDTDTIANNNNDTEVTSVDELKKILHQCRLIIGFHPDQATGDIVQLAEHLNIPWCIVPCCVYSDIFTKRRLQDGTPVKSYEQLVQWLCEKSPHTQLATMENLEGKNQVVYTLP